MRSEKRQQPSAAGRQEAQGSEKRKNSLTSLPSFIFIELQHGTIPTTQGGFGLAARLPVRLLKVGFYVPYLRY